MDFAAEADVPLRSLTCPTHRLHLDWGPRGPQRIEGRAAGEVRSAALEVEVLVSQMIQSTSQKKSTHYAFHVKDKVVVRLSAYSRPLTCVFPFPDHPQTIILQ